MNHVSQGLNVMTAYELFQQHNVNSATALSYSTQIIFCDTLTCLPIGHGGRNNISQIHCETLL